MTRTQTLKWLHLFHETVPSQYVPEIFPIMLPIPIGIPTLVESLFAEDKVMNSFRSFLLSESLDQDGYRLCLLERLVRQRIIALKSLFYNASLERNKLPGGWKANLVQSLRGTKVDGE